MHALRTTILVSLLCPTSALGQDASVAIYRFDVHAAAGGLEITRAAHDLWAGDPFDASAEGMEDRIIEQALVPLLDVYEAHPAWGADFALSGALVDILANRHPDVLAQLQRLDGQLHYGGFTYAGTLWTTEPTAVTRRSLEATKAAFASAGLTRSRVVASGAGQFGPGLDDLLDPGGVVVISAADWAEISDETARLYALGETTVVVGGSDQLGEDTLRWTFDGDALSLASAGVSVAQGPGFITDATAIAEHEGLLGAREAAGFAPTALADIVDRALDTTVLPPMPSTVDQAREGWLGGVGTAVQDEADGAVRRALATAWRHVHTAEGLAEDPAEDVDAAWSHLLHVGVAAATGPDPLQDAVAFALAHAEAAQAAVASRLAVAGAPCSEFAVFERAALSCSPGWGINRRAPEELLEGVSGLAFGEVGFVLDVDQFEDPDLIGDPLVLTLTHRSGVDLANGGPLHPRALLIPFDAELIRIVPAGRTGSDIEPFVSIPTQQGAGRRLPLGGGVLDLGTAGFLVLDPVAAPPHIEIDGDAGLVVIRDETGGVGVELWEVYVVERESDALSLARRLIQQPALYLPGPELPEPEVPSACEACSANTAGSSAASAWVLGLLLLLSARRVTSPRRGPTTPR
jgi:hypothetical protein